MLFKTGLRPSIRDQCFDLSNILVLVNIQSLSEHLILLSSSYKDLVPAYSLLIAL